MQAAPLYDGANDKIGAIGAENQIGEHFNLGLVFDFIDQIWVLQKILRKEKTSQHKCFCFYFLTL